MIKRISTKKTYKVTFSDDNNTVTIEVTGKKAMFEMAASSRGVCNFVPRYMNVEDVETGDLNRYMLSFQPISL